jgi:hypothetical protein
VPQAPPPVTVTVLRSADTSAVPPGATPLPRKGAPYGRWNGVPVRSMFALPDASPEPLQLPAEPYPRLAAASRQVEAAMQVGLPVVAKVRSSPRSVIVSRSRRTLSKATT